ncbi:MAG: MBL fold metallo-hydrolase [Anaerolineae bacterium]
MLFERIESKGLVHNSYLIGLSGEAIVIDPRRDCDVYVERATKEGFRIRHILETHRNEDYAIGSLELAARTGAVVWHADGQWPYQYGQAVEPGQKWRVAGLRLEAIHTPGHTPGSMSYLLSNAQGVPWVVFTGDVLFAGEVGRTDLLGQERLKEMTGLLYDTLQEKILPLGDEVIVCPAHGAGSACGAAIADRPWTTIGYERKHNPRLMYSDKGDFMENVGRMLERPHYFQQMEALNLAGPPVLGALPVPTPLTAGEFAERANDAIVLDTRMELGFAAAHVPGALSMWLAGVPSFAGWFLPYDRPILLVNETDNPSEVTRYLVRMGYDSLAGYLAGSMLSWHKSGLESKSIATVTVQELCRRLDRGEEVWVLDVRSKDELEHMGEVPRSHHIHITQLPERMMEVPKDHMVYVFCGSGLRSMIAASLLQRQGWRDVTVVLGGFAGWSSTRCPLEPRKAETDWANLLVF